MYIDDADDNAAMRDGSAVPGDQEEKRVSHKPYRNLYTMSDRKV